MTDRVSSQVLRRKMTAGGPRPEPASITPMTALDQALKKTAEALMQTAVTVTEVSLAPVAQADLPAALRDRGLLMRLAGPDGAVGVMAVSRELTAALTERRTTGRIGSAAVQPRRPTQTDALIAAGFFDPVLAAMPAALAVTGDRVWTSGWRFAAFADDLRPLLLILEERCYQSLTATVEMTSSASRSGALRIVLPDMHPPARGGQSRAGADPGEAGAQADDPSGWADRLGAAVMGSPAMLNGILWRLSLPLQDALALAPGSLLPVPREAADRVVLEARDGTVLARGRLGQSRGRRALRVSLRMTGGTEPDMAAAELQPAPGGRSMAERQITSAPITAGAAATDDAAPKSGGEHASAGNIQQTAEQVR